MKIKHRREMKWAVSLTLLYFCNIVVTAAPKDTQAIQQCNISSNAVVQSEISRIIDLCSNNATSEDTAKQAIEAFLSFKGLDRRELLLQALLSYKGDADHRENPQGELLKRTLIFRLAEGIPEQDLIALLVPYLEATTEPQMQHNLMMPLNAILFRNGRHRPDFIKLEPFLATKKASLPTNLITRVMLQSNSHAALNTLAEVYTESPDEKKLLQATASKIQKASETMRSHMPDNGEMRDMAMSELAELSSRKEWWVRLYVVAVMEKEPYLRTSELMKKLEQDPDPLVREKVFKLKDKLQPK